MKQLQTVRQILAVLGISLGMSLAQAQSFPDRTIALVVPNPPGGLVDTSRAY